MSNNYNTVKYIKKHFFLRFTRISQHCDTIEEFKEQNCTKKIMTKAHFLSCIKKIFFIECWIFNILVNVKFHRISLLIKSYFLLNLLLLITFSLLLSVYYKLTYVLLHVYYKLTYFIRHSSQLIIRVYFRSVLTCRRRRRRFALRTAYFVEWALATTPS